jgi:hypothetical protein
VSPRLVALIAGGIDGGPVGGCLIVWFGMRGGVVEFRVCAELDTLYR